MKKRAYLFLALLLPGLVFVFLKYFGSNRFDIPVYYTDSVKAPQGCNVIINAPYILPDSVWKYFPERKVANVIAVTVSEEDVKEVSDALRKEFGDNVTVRSMDQLSLVEATRSRWAMCVFLAEDPKTTVLFDNQGRIRGYYDIRSLDEVDRLRVELKILLEQY